MKKSVAKKPAKKLQQKTTVHRTKASKSATAASEPRSKAAPAPKQQGASVCWDHNRRTTILLSRSDSSVKHVALDVENGLEVTESTPRDFDDRYTAMVDYPVERAAKLYVEYARGLGATEQVMQALGKLTPVSKEDIEMATKKKAARAAAPVKTAKKATTKKTAAEKPTKAATKTAKAPAEKKERAPRGPTAAQKFQELIMEGKGGTCAHTDDQIFAKVQKEFGLDDSKRSYVKWYRNYLTKQGKNPPAAKE